MMAATSSPGTVAVRLEGVGHGQHHRTVALEEPADLLEERFEPPLDPFAERRLEPHAVGTGLDRLTGGTRDHRLGDQVRRDRSTPCRCTPPLHRDRGRRSEVTADPDRVVPVEEHALAGERRHARS